MGNLEENSKKILIAFHKGEIPIFGPITKAVDLTNEEVIDAVNHLEENNYWEIIGGTPKSGPRYKITEAGFKYASITK
jgi:hypothetical protein